MKICFSPLPSCCVRMALPNSTEGPSVNYDQVAAPSETHVVVDSDRNTLFPPGNMNNTFATINLAKAMVGPGCLALPSCVGNAGLALTMAGYVVVGLLSWYTMLLIVRCYRIVAAIEAKTGKPYRRLSMTQIAEFAFGPLGAVLGSVSTFMMGFGIVCTYVTFLGREVSELTVGWWPWMTPRIAIMLCFPLVCPFALLPSFKSITPIAVFGLLALLTACGFVVADCYHPMDSPGDMPWSDLALFNWSQAPKFFSGAVFVFTLHCILPEPAQAMKKEKRFGLVAFVSVLLSVTLFASWSVMVYGYYVTAHRTVDGNIMNSMFPGWQKTSVIITMCLTVYLSYPLYIFSLFRLVESGDCCGGSIAMKYGTRLLLIALSVGLGLAIPNYKTITVLCGALGSTTISFTLPAFMYVEMLLLKAEGGPAGKPSEDDSSAPAKPPSESSVLLPNSATTADGELRPALPRFLSKNVVRMLRKFSWRKRLELVGCILIGFGGIFLTIVTVVSVIANPS